MPTLHPSLLVSVLTTVGGVILFASFIAQNYFLAKRSATRQRLMMSELAVNSMVVRADHWRTVVAAESSKKSDRNEQLLAIGALGYIQTLCTLDQLTTARTLDKQKETDIALSLHQKELAIASELFDRRDAKALVVLVNQLEDEIQTKSNGDDDPNHRMIRHFSKISQQEARWNNFFVGAYVVGSIILGVTYWLGRHGRYAEF